MRPRLPTGGTAPTDAEGHTAYDLKDGKLVPNEAFFRRLDARLKAVNDAGLLAVPVLAWAHKKGDAGFDLPEDQLVTLIKFEVARYKDAHCLFILAGVIANMHIYFRPETLLNTLIMLVLLVGGLGLIARSMRSHRRPAAE